MFLSLLATITMRSSGRGDLYPYGGMVISSVLYKFYDVIQVWESLWVQQPCHTQKRVFWNVLPIHFSLAFFLFLFRDVLWAWGRRVIQMPYTEWQRCCDCAFSSHLSSALGLVMSFWITLWLLQKEAPVVKSHLWEKAWICRRQFDGHLAKQQG